MTAVGIARARDLSNRRPVSEETLRRMVSYFARHEVDKRSPGWSAWSKGRQAWEGWGGDAGRKWATSLVDQADRRKPNPHGGTAIARRVPAPARAVKKAERVSKATTLDVGSGLTAWGATRYDPHHPSDKDALRRRYPVVTAFYVLCVIPTTKERTALARLVAGRLAKKGRAYFAVRTDDPCSGEGSVATSRGHQVCKTPQAWRSELGKTFCDVEEWDKGSGYVTLRCGRPR